ncbi:MAG: hypothetical protein E6J34_22495 [Chloroflexi bacterium]|nr:MAG: hypothetical protein E6J34_22495 [Chloroflexota bacterium]
MRSSKGATMRNWSIIPGRTDYAQRLQTMYTQLATSWERVYRQVFWLADGSRNVERISKLLHKPADKIEQVIDDLLVSGYIKVNSGEKELAMNPVLLKQSFQMVTPHREEFARRFYALLFEQYPQLRSLFPSSEASMRKQETSLISTLAVVVAGVERGDNMAEVIRSLGERHARYGAQAAYYPIVGKLLIHTFQDFLGDAFTPQMKAAWTQAYEIISAEMLKGADRATHVTQ